MNTDDIRSFISQHRKISESLSILKDKLTTKMTEEYNTKLKQNTERE